MKTILKTGITVKEICLETCLLIYECQGKESKIRVS